jgi:5'-nucleotidase (lipoprotein e(P4) family)
MTSLKSLTLVAFVIALSSCTPRTDELIPEPDLAMRWTAYAAEYQAASAQVYAQATRDLPRLIADPAWSAVPGQEGIGGKPPAIILDVDETVVSNSDFELTMIPYSTRGHYDWSSSHKAIPIRGVVEFIAAARELGVEVFFVTNRPCDTFDGVDGDCPMKAATINDIEEIGIDTDGDHVLLADEIPDWDREKVVRREYVAETHRVIMLFGDDYGDFVACSRVKPLAPCTIPATRDSRAIALETYKDYWGNGWYILPNPMHGSWTSVE